MFFLIQLILTFLVVRAVYESTPNIDSSASIQGKNCKCINLCLCKNYQKSDNIQLFILSFLDVTLQLQIRENHILAQNIPIQDMFNTSTAEDVSTFFKWAISRNIVKFTKHF